MKVKMIIMCLFLFLLIIGCVREYELILEKNAITLSEGETASVAITSGNGKYKSASSNEAIATAVPSSNKIEITAKSYGTAAVIVTDAESKQATITVTVSSGALKDTELRFEWDGLKVLLDNEANGWGKTQKYQSSADIGIIHLAQKKSLRTQGLKEYEKGVKTGVKLLIIENGAAEQTIPLDKFEIVEVANGVFTAVGNSGEKKLVIRDVIP
jgi:hypothetical protein